MNAPIKALVGLLTQAGRRPSRNTRRIHQMRDAQFDAKAAAEEINAAWRNRTPEQIAAHELRQIEQAARRISDDQFDAEREADEQGISTRRYLRGA